MESAIYEGVVRHRHFGAVPHAFTYRLFMMYLDLAELPEVFRGRWLWSESRVAPARFRRDDHLGDPDVPLDTAVRDLVEARAGARPAGPIRLLTHLRYFGYVFNPVSLFYCFEPAGRRLEWVVAEVHNTPWNERHAYVLDVSRAPRRGTLHRLETAKEFHVSPFLGMDQRYVWQLREPDRRLVVRIQNLGRDGERQLDAVLALRRREISAPALASVLVRHPLMTARVVAGIYWQAFRLRRKRAPVFPHPGERELAARAAAP